MADRHGMRDAVRAVEQVQEKAGRFGQIAGRLRVVHAQCALQERARRGGHQGTCEQRGDVPVDVPGKHADDVRVPPDHGAELGGVGQHHAVEERHPHGQRRMVKADECGRLRPGSQGPVDPGELVRAEIPGRTPGEPGVGDDDGGLRVLHDVRRGHAVSKERRVAEPGDERARVVVVARREVNGYRAAPENGAEHGVLFRMPAIGEIASDDNAVGPRLDRQQTAECLSKVRGGLGRQGSPHQVRVAEMGDPHVLDGSNRGRRFGAAAAGRAGT